jgi:probable F420-dependent oxidoreductase
MVNDDVIRSVRAHLGPVGVWLAALRPAPIDLERQAVRRIEELGYGSIWTGEGIGGKEAFAHLSLVLTSTKRVIAGTGIANLWARHPAAMQGGASTLGAAYPGRFILGVGVSHGSMVERSGQEYQKPLSRMRQYLDDMDAAAPDTPVTEVPVPRVLAALGPKMLQLARDRADGAHPYFVPPAHTVLGRDALGPGKLLVPEQAVVVGRDAAQARSIAREHMAGYLGMPNYVNNLAHLGYTDDDVADGGSDRLVDAIVAWGSAEDIAARVREHLDAGADHVLLQPLGSLGAALDQLEVLAPIVLGA